MTINLGKLTKAGFEPAGRWLLAEPGLEMVLEGGTARETNVLYAFAVDGALAYVGKTVQSLQKRMQGYKSPAVNANSGATTNIKNNRNIIAALSAGHTVDIFVLRSQGSQRHGEFEINLAAGLEDSLISALSPPWNGRRLAAASLIHTQVSPAARRVMPITNSVTRDKLASAITSANPATQGATMTPLIPSAEILFAFARSQNAEIFLTLQRKNPFHVEVVGNFLEIMPGSSKTPRRESRDSVAAVLARFAKIVSFKMSDYQDLSFNASYVLALLKCWQVSVRRLPQV